MLYIFVTYWITFHVFVAYHSLILVIFYILLLAWITKIGVFDSIIIICLFYTIILAPEFLIQTIEMFAFNIDLNQIFLNSKYLWIFIIVSKVLQILIVSMIFKFNVCFTKLKLFEKEGLIFDNLIIELGVFALFVFCINYGIFNIGNFQIYNIIIFSIYFVF
ncbi:histidine kinase, partial [Clostridium autoethanogenum]